MSAIIKTLDCNKWIIKNFPEKYEEMLYLEPFCGSESVILNKEKSKEEYINDINSNITNIYKIIRDDVNNFIKCLEKIEYKIENFEFAKSRNDFVSKLDSAINEFVLIKMSKNNLKQDFFDSTREEKKWDNIKKNLPTVSNRLENIFIFNKDATEVIYSFDTPNTLVYCNPPYINDLNTENHIKLCNILNKFTGNVIITSNPSALYSKMFKDWNYKINKSKPNKINAIWTNY